MAGVLVKNRAVLPITDSRSYHLWHKEKETLEPYIVSEAEGEKAGWHSHSIVDTDDDNIVICRRVAVLSTLSLVAPNNPA